jgi:hypothetical protein
MYQALANKYFIETNTSVDKITVIKVQINCNSNRKIKGCDLCKSLFLFLDTNNSMAAKEISNIKGSSGRSVPRDEEKLYSTDHGIEASSR